MAKNKNCEFLKFYGYCNRGHTFCSNWLKFGPDTPYMTPNKVTEDILKVLIFSDFNQIFHQKISDFVIFL